MRSLLVVCGGTDWTWSVERYIVILTMGTSEQAFLILAALADQPRHGYGIIKDVEEQTGGDVVLAAGTLYGALDRLASQGWIELESTERDGNRVRRLYRLTPEGQRLLLAELARRERTVAVARRRVAPWPTTDAV